VSLLNSIAKVYVRLVFRETGEFDALKTQRQLNIADPPGRIARRAERVDHTVRAFWIDRENAHRGVLVYLHGGAFYFGPVKEHWQYLAHICNEAQMAGIMVDYGFAPQRPFPIGLDEIVELVGDLGLSENWFFVGDSSGAAMAVSATFRLSETDASMPKGLMLLSPWVDVTLENPGIETNKHEDVMMTVERLASAARVYVGEHDPYDPAISPMFGDVSGLPPVLIQMGTADLLLSDARKFHEKCVEAGVDVRYEEFPDCFHDFMMLSFLPEAKTAIRSQVEFLRGPTGFIQADVVARPY